MLLQRLEISRQGVDLERRVESCTRDVALMLAQANWRTEELHSEEGRMDDVFRSITLPDTVTEKAK